MSSSDISWMSVCLSLITCKHYQKIRSLGPLHNVLTTGGWKTQELKAKQTQLTSLFLFSSLYNTVVSLIVTQYFFSIARSVLSFTKQLLRASRRAKRRLKNVLRKSSAVCYINGIIIGSVKILYWSKSSLRIWTSTEGLDTDSKEITSLFECSVDNQNIMVFDIYICFFCLLRHFSIQPVCSDLQSQILKCYKENTGKTLSCSGIASAYMQCVENARKVWLTVTHHGPPLKFA